MNKLYVRVYDRVADCFVGSAIPVTSVEHAKRLISDAVRGTEIMNHVADYDIRFVELDDSAWKVAFSVSELALGEKNECVKD